LPVTSNTIPVAAVYLLLAATALAFWFFSPPERKFVRTPLVFALGSIMLALKGVFLLQKSSEDYGRRRFSFFSVASQGTSHLPTQQRKSFKISEPDGYSSGPR
jgi:hypothetical protein